MNETGTTQRTRIPVATVSQVLEREDATVIDLRSPAEFAQDHLPGAHNVPLFDDLERAVIGTLYSRESPSAAFDEGRAITRRHIGELMRRIAQLAGEALPEVDLVARVEAMTRAGICGLESELTPDPVNDADELPERALVLHCWRGGLRSRSVIALARSIGIERAFGLEGGYKAYRQHVLENIDAWMSPPAFVLRGLTGVGKTLVLRELERIRPGWTLDLEGAAGHRSSLLGMVGLEPCTQKTFESRLCARLRRGFRGPVVFEGESRKVGDVTIPARIWTALQGGQNIELCASTARRVDTLIEDYLARDENRPALRTQLALIEKQAQKNMQRALPLVELFDAGRERELVEVLLEQYYDPLYRHSEKEKSYALNVDAEDPQRAALAIANWIEQETT